MNAEPGNAAAAMRAFATAEVRPQLPQLDSHSFPNGLWRRMGDAGLLGIGIAETRGGQGGGYREIGLAGRALVAGGGSLGLGMSWMLHSLVGSHLLQRFADARQQQAYLPAMAAGRITASVAISEPGAGAHPKHLRTAARREGEDFRIDGEKSYVTNGPIADLYIVLAITSETAGRKSFSAFLVPRDTPGRSIVETAPFDFFKPSPHCGLKFEDCRVPASALLGPEGKAFQAFAGPFRDIEDAVSTALSSGAAAFLLGRLAELARAQGQPDDAAAEQFGSLAATSAVLASTSDRLLEHLEIGSPVGDLAPLLLGFRQLNRQFASDIEACRTALGLPADRAIATLTRDLAKSMDIAKLPRLMKQRALGKQVWNGS